MEDLIAADDRIITKIYDVDKYTNVTSTGGLYTGNVLNPLMDLCQIGVCVSVGKKINYIKDGEMILVNWMCLDTDDNYLGRDEEGEFRYVTEKQIYGTVKHKHGRSHIIPKKNYVMAYPQDHKEFAHTKNMFQIPVAAINPDDVAMRKKIKVGDLILVVPYGAVRIFVQRVEMWFVHFEEILLINRGEHKIRAYRKYVSPILKQASRKELVQLN